MEASSRKRLSLDTNVLFDLADGKDFAHDFREAYQRKGYTLVICVPFVRLRCGRFSRSRAQPGEMRFCG